MPYWQARYGRRCDRWLYRPRTGLASAWGADQGNTGGSRQTLDGLGEWAWSRKAFLFSWQCFLLFGGGSNAGSTSPSWVSRLFC